MIYILYEANKTNSIELSKKLFFLQTLFQSNLQFERTRLREEEHRNLKNLFMALLEDVTDNELSEMMQRQIKKKLQEVLKFHIRYASAHHIKQGEEVHYLICLEQDCVYPMQGVQFIVYHSEIDEAIVVEHKDGFIQVFLNLDRLKEDRILSKFAQGLDDLMLKEPSLQLLQRVCDMHPLFYETIPYLLMFLCHANRLQIQVHRVREPQSMLH